MDQERMEKLFRGQEYMEAELLTKLQSFNRFTENTVPVITILCTENRLRMNMDKLAANVGQAEIHVYGTSDGIEEALEKAMYSDAVFVNTLALKIAPEGLYKILKELSELEKEVYFILSGWESLPKTSELCKKKMLQVDIEFPFSKILMCRNVFIKPLEGFFPIEDVIAEYTERCVNSFSKAHIVQEEALYKKLRNDVNCFRENLCVEIQREQGIIMQIQQIMLAKQKRYEIIFPHATVGINDALERFERSLTAINIDDVLFHIEKENNCPARETFASDSSQVQRSAKYYVSQFMTESMDRYLEKGTSTLDTQNGKKVSDAVNDLLSVSAKLKECRFIDKYEVEELTAAIERSGKLVSQADSYSQSLAFIFDKVRNSIEAKIMAFQFNDNLGFNLANIISKISSTNGQAKDNNEDQLSLDTTDEEQDSETNQEEKGIMNRTIATIKHGGREVIEWSDECKEDSEWTQFCAELERLISFAKNTMTSLLGSSSKLTNEEIEVQCRNTVQEYFGFIIKQLDVISHSLAAMLDSFGRNELWQ